MSQERLREFDPRVLDLHLGVLSSDEQAAAHESIASDAALAGQHESLSRVFAALGAIDASAPPADLAARCLLRVRAAGPAPRATRAAERLTRAVERQELRILRLASLREVVAVAAMIVLAIGLGMPGLMHLRERGQRVACAYNLAQIGTGIQQYASTFNASLPFAGWSDASSWRPTGAPGVIAMPNRRHVFPLLQRAYVADPSVFVCPGQLGVPLAREAARRSSDFVDDRNVTYAYQNMAGVRPTTNDDPALPIMSDANPLFADGVPLLDAARGAWRDAGAMNSRAHRGGGQNLLVLSGHVRWATTPDAGVHNDNIWTLRGVSDYTGREGPLAATDSHLLE